MPTSLSRRNLLAGLAAGTGLAASSALLPLPVHAAFGPPAGMIKLSSNENPYGPSPKALKAIAEAAGKGAYYAGAPYRELTARIAAANGLDPENVVITSGSSSVLQATGRAYSKQGALLLPELTFDGPLRYSERLGAELRRVPLAADMDTNLDAMAAAVDDDVAMVYVCNPNNPTGIAIDPAKLRAFCRKVAPQTPVLIDEAYNELTDLPEEASMVDLVRAGENVVVTRTFSKIFGLAGLRIGYALAPAEHAEMIRRHTMSQSNVAGLAAALASYEDEAFLEFSKAKVVEGRQLVMDVFDRHEVPYLPSQTNFVYGDIGRDADVFQQLMRERNVMIRGIYRDYTTWSRVSMGRIEDLEVFARVFHEVYTG
ncbi:MAG: histidinol-phosphate transaminase [Pseudomonadales bacterium]|jgi:histidinol-phosphate aminotransferase|nr:histidinol-phosphate transaminase [Pseudomonadales bacterium]